MPKLLDINEFCKDLKEITTEKIMNKKKFHPEGLFSEQIFGPLKNYTCQCGTYYGISKSGGTCEICGDYLNTRVVNNVWFGDFKVSFIHRSMQEILRDILLSFPNFLLAKNFLSTFNK